MSNHDQILAVTEGFEVESPPKQHLGAADVGHNAVLAAINEEMSEMDNEAAQQERRLQGEVNFLPGTLKELAPDSRAQWTGGISVERRLKSGEITHQDIEHVKNRVNDFYIKTTPGSIVRCIDGRTGAKFLAGARSVMEKSKLFLTEKIGLKNRTISKDSPIFEELGPQIPGGTLAGGVSYRHAASASFGEFRNATIAEDAKTYGEKSSEGPGGYKAGDHKANPEKPGLGCGAVDGLEAIHEKVNPNNLNTIYGLTKGLLGDRFNEKHFTHFESSAISLASNENYFASKAEAIKYLEDHNPDSLPELVGEHNEVLVMVNLVHGTTLHRDYLNAAMLEETGKDMQVFGYDLWYSEDMAKKLFPDNEAKQELYVHCRVAKAVAALMYLVDGTIEIGTRTPLQKDYDLVS